MRNAIYPGSFDPLTSGHYDIIKRAAKLVDTLYVVVADNIQKKYSFDSLERVELIKKALVGIDNVIVDRTNDLIVRYAKNNNINIIIRGLRNYSDYDMEYSLFQFNKHINKDIETIFLIPLDKRQYISSSSIKELVSYDCDISKYVPKEICEDIIKKIEIKIKTILSLSL